MTPASSSRSRTSKDYAKLGRWDRFRQWLHMHHRHQLCRVVVGKVVTGYKSDFSPEYLVGKDPNTGEETRVEVTVFGGRRVPIEDWVVRHG